MVIGRPGDDANRPDRYTENKLLIPVISFAKEKQDKATYIGDCKATYIRHCLRI
jgi:hypothetical protein